MSDQRLMPIHDPELLARGERVLGPEFRAMSARVLETPYYAHVHALIYINTFFIFGNLQMSLCRLTTVWQVHQSVVE